MNRDSKGRFVSEKNARTANELYVAIPSVFGHVDPNVVVPDQYNYTPHYVKFAPGTWGAQQASPETMEALWNTGIAHNSKAAIDSMQAWNNHIKQRYEEIRQNVGNPKNLLPVKPSLFHRILRSIGLR